MNNSTMCIQNKDDPLHKNTLFSKLVLTYYDASSFN